MKLLIVSADVTESHGRPRNIGDSFLTDGLASGLSSLGISVTVADFGHERVVDHPDLAQRRQITSLRELMRAIAQHDGVVIGGGTLLADDQPERAFAGLPRLCLAVSLCARLSRRPVVFFGVGMDPVHRPRARFALALAVAGRAVWVRDADSQKRVEGLLFARRVAVSGDACLLYPAWRLPKRKRRVRHQIVALNRRDEAMSEQVLRSVSGSTRDAPVRFLSMDQSDRPDASGDSEAFLNSAKPVDWPEALSWISEASCVVASRMHALYMAVLLGVPSVALTTSPKLSTFVKQFPAVSSAHSATGSLPEPSAPDLHAVRVLQDDAYRALRTMVSGMVRR